MRIICLLALAAILPGCSVVRLAYNQAPDALYWWLDGYFDFTEAQSLRVREDLGRLQQWHRRNELGAYAGLLRRAQDLAPGAVDAARTCDLASEARGRLLAVADQLAPTMAAIAPTLSAAQLARLDEKFAERNRSWSEEWLRGTPERRLQRRADQARERAERFYGPLDEAQRALVLAQLRASPFDPEMNLRETVRRQRDTLQTLRSLQGQEPGSEAVRRQLRALVERALESPDPQYRAYLQRWMQSSCAMAAALHNSTTGEQRQRALAALRGYEEDARTLSAQR